MPTHRRPPAAEEDPVRYRNLLDQVTSTLRQRGDLTTRELQDLLAPLEELTAPDFWVEHLDGLAVYRSKDGAAVYRLPGPVHEQALVSDQFFIRPLLPFVSDGSRFFVLALSQGDVTLYEGDRFGLWALDLPDLPADLKDVVGTEEAHQPAPRFNQAAGRDPMHQGMSWGLRDNEPDQERYFRMVDSVISQRLKGVDAPLVLAAPAEEWDLYRRVNHSPQLLDTALTGNHDRDTPDLLHHYAWPLVAPVFEERKRTLLERYGELASAGKAAADDVDAIALAATEGRILALLLAEGRTLSGTYDPDTGQVSGPVVMDVASGDDTLLNALAEQTLRRGGEVYVVPRAEMPVDMAVAAIFRY